MKAFHLMLTIPQPRSPKTTYTHARNPTSLYIHIELGGPQSSSELSGSLIVEECVYIYIFFAPAAE